MFYIRVMSGNILLLPVVVTIYVMLSNYLMCVPYLISIILKVVSYFTRSYTIGLICEVLSVLMKLILGGYLYVLLHNVIGLGLSLMTFAVVLIDGSLSAHYAIIGNPIESNIDSSD